jgi:hypothetical protein
MSDEIKYLEYIDTTNPVHVIYPITVGPGEAISVISSSSDVTFQAFGFEIEIATETAGEQQRLGAVVGTYEYGQDVYTASAGYEAILKIVVTYTASSGNQTYTISHVTI